MERFPLEELKRRDQFISLLFYMGILTIDGVSLGGTRFRIPNRTVKTILFSYIEESLAWNGDDLLGMQVIAQKSLSMARNGDWRPVLEYIHGKIADTTGIRDFIEGERCIQIAHLVTLWPISCYLPRTECEAAKGYLDLILFPNHTRGVDVPYTYAIEFKYRRKTLRTLNCRKLYLTRRYSLHAMPRTKWSAPNVQAQPSPPSLSSTGNGTSPSARPLKACNCSTGIP